MRIFQEVRRRGSSLLLRLPLRQRLGRENFRQDILQDRWLADEKLTLHELADKYNISAERIRQIEKNAMKKIKQAFSPED